MYKGVIFDLDGTLLNTLFDLTEAINLTVKNYGVNNYSLEEVKKNIGWGWYELVKRSLPQDAKEETIQEALNVFAENYGREYCNKTIPYDGIKELIDEIVKEKILIGVNSNKREDYTKKLIEINFKNIDLDFVLGKREDRKSKPDPESNLLLLKKMKLNKDEVLYVGDSLIDIETAKNSKLKVCSITWGFRDKKELTSGNPDYIVDNPKDILKILKGEKK